MLFYTLYTTKTSLLVIYIITFHRWLIIWTNPCFPHFQFHRFRALLIHPVDPYEGKISLPCVRSRALKRDLARQKYQKMRWDCNKLLNWSNPQSFYVTFCSFLSYRLNEKQSVSRYMLKEEFWVFYNEQPIFTSLHWLLSDSPLICGVPLTYTDRCLLSLLHPVTLSRHGVRLLVCGCVQP